MEKKIESLIKEHKIIAILRGVPSEKIVDVAKALYDGGIRLLEITFNQKSETHTFFILLHFQFLSILLLPEHSIFSGIHMFSANFIIAYGSF